MLAKEAKQAQPALSGQAGGGFVLHLASARVVAGAGALMSLPGARLLPQVPGSQAVSLRA